MRRVEIVLLFVLISINSINSEESSRIKIPITVAINNIVTSEVICEVDPNSQVLTGIEPGSIHKILESFMEKNIIKIFFKEYESTNAELIDIEDLKKLGLDYEYNSTDLLLDIVIPIELQKSKKLSIIPNNSKTYDTDYKPLDFTAYLNFFVNQNFTEETGVIESSVYSASYTIDTAFNIKQWVLTGKLNLNSEGFYELPDVTVTKDLTKYNLRLILGNYTTKTSGFQASGLYQGLSIHSKDYSESGKNSSQNIPILIEQFSNAKVIMNGRTIRNLSLSPGNYMLDDFPFYNGLNSIELNITPNSGEPYVINFTLPQYARNITQGSMDYAYSLGFPKWDPVNFLLSGYHNYGLLNQLTVGANLQISTNTLLLGNRALYSTFLGNFLLDYGLHIDNFKNIRPGYGGKISYRYVNNSKPILPVFSINTGIYSQRFMTQVNSKPLFLDLSTSLSQKIIDDFTGSLSLSYQKYHLINQDNLILNFKLNYLLKKNTIINLSFRSSLIDPDLETASLLFTFNYTGEINKEKISYSQDFITAKQKIEWQPNLQKFGIDFSASYENSSHFDTLKNSFKGNIHYSGNRYNISASTQYYDLEETKQWINNINLSSAIAYAGGKITLSKTISDSFVIVVPRYELEGKGIGLNYNKGRYEGKSSIGGPAIISSLGSYQTKKIDIELLNNNLDLFILNNEIYIKPYFKSGTVIYTGDQKEIVVNSIIKNIQGEILPLRVGYIKGNKKEVTFFTNTNAMATIYGLSEGTYELKLEGFKIYNLEVKTPDTGSSMDLEIILEEIKEEIK